MSRTFTQTMITRFKPLLVPALAACLLLAGCVVTSVYPYFTAKDVVVDPALVGTWAELDQSDPGNQHWEFARTNGQAYTLLIRQADETNQFKAHLFELRGRRFMDAEPWERPEDFIPPHYLFQVHRLDAKGLEMSIMSQKWLENLLEAKPKAIAHLWIDRDADDRKQGRLVLTADTASLQAFVLKHAADTNAFATLFKLVRR